MKLIKTSHFTNSIAKIARLEAENAVENRALDIDPDKLAKAIAEEMETTYSRAIAREKAIEKIKRSGGK